MQRISYIVTCLTGINLNHLTTETILYLIMDSLDENGTVVYFEEMKPLFKENVISLHKLTA